MKLKLQNMLLKNYSVAVVILLSCLSSVPRVLAQATLPAQPTVATSVQPTQKTFATPREAADALVKAAGVYDVAALKEILGPDGMDLITSQDPVMDKNRAVDFANKAKEKLLVNVDPKNPNVAMVSAGKDDFPLPIPIVKDNSGKWYFDTQAGREEILNRRIGANELDAIQILRGFDEAQREYASEKHDGSKINQYAQRMISSPGKQDGLAWRNPDGSWGGPIGEEVASALAQGYSQRSQPYHGYYFKVLTGQGPAAPHGEMNFVINGAMIGGFALAAAPAQYRVTGVKTFIVGPQGIVYEKDLGPDTLKAFYSVERYNPDSTWQPTNDQWPSDLEDKKATE